MGCDCMSEQVLPCSTKLVTTPSLCDPPSLHVTSSVLWVRQRVGGCEAGCVVVVVCVCVCGSRHLCSCLAPEH